MSEEKSFSPENEEIQGENSDTASAEQAIQEAEIPSVMPLLAVRDIVVFNYMILPLFVGREKSVQAVDAALNGSRYIFISTQKDEGVDEPTPDDLYATGTVAMIMRMLKMPDGRLKVLVQGLTRARIQEFVQHAPFDMVRIETIDELVVENPGPEEEALLRSVKEQSEKILTLRGIDSAEIMNVLNAVNEHGRLADLVASNLRMKSSEAQRILESHDPIERLNLVNSQLVKEVEVASMQAKIQSMAKEGMDKAQREYFLREQLKAIRRELGDKGGEGEEMEELRKTLNALGLPKKVKKEADKQLSRLESMHPDSSEATILRTYIDWIIDLPWKKASKDRLDIKEAARILHEDHYNLEKVKERILEYLSVRKLNPTMKGPILCFVGPPGVGKTSLGKSIARSLGRKFVRMSLGGMRDEAEIRGHRRTYIGAMPGRIIQTLRSVGVRNPVFMLDEMDKIGQRFPRRPVLGPAGGAGPGQNNSFTDHYLNVPYDLSKVMFICTANMLDTIPSALLDRMEVIRIPGYTEQEKIVIARRYLLTRQIRENGLTDETLVISDAVLAEIIRGYTREAGLRNLEREIGSVCRKYARRVAEGRKGPFRVTSASLIKLLGQPKFMDEERESAMPPGVAWAWPGPRTAGRSCTSSAACCRAGQTHPDGQARRGDEGERPGRAELRAQQERHARHRRGLLRHPRHPHPRPGRRHPQGRALGRRDPGHGPDVGHHQRAHRLGRGHDRRDHPARAGHARGRHQGEDPGRGQPRGEQGPHPGPQRPRPGRDPQELRKRITVRTVEAIDEIWPEVRSTTAK
ncbi:hypothetical protein MASR1M66_21440 [Aminivibrio sp.]